MRLGKSNGAAVRIHGLGLYVAEPIPGRARIWEFNPVMDRVVSREEFESLPPAAREFLRVYAYPWPKGGDTLLFSADNGHFPNHSDDANTFEDAHHARPPHDIAVGEETTSDYRRLGHNMHGSFESDSGRWGNEDGRQEDRRVSS